jgi:hypothetical protein
MFSLSSCPTELRHALYFSLKIIRLDQLQSDLSHEERENGAREDERRAPGGQATLGRERRRR